ncbi:MAG: flagellar export chaperone FliS [Pseudomonadales bacterium]|jgi:flagellar protein FliS|nr:flagellar export chaperone FliS [Pseudomonadales bacterium]
MQSQQAMNQYKAVGVQSGLESASPHTLIQMLLDGALGRLALAKGFMERSNHEQKGKAISSAISIIGGLQGSLDLDKGGEIAVNLNALYSYMTERLFKAGTNNDIETLNEISGLLEEIREGWQGIKAEVGG